MRTLFGKICLVLILFAGHSIGQAEFQKKLDNLNLILDSNKAKQQASPVVESGEGPDLAAITFRLGISLVVVVGLIFVLYRIARKVRKMDLPPSQGGKAIQLLESYHVGNQQKILLMRVGENRVILIGVTPENMSNLAQFEGDDAKTMLPTYSNTVGVTPAQFSETVNQMLSRFRKDGAK